MKILVCRLAVVKFKISLAGGTRTMAQTRIRGNVWHATVSGALFSTETKKPFGDEVENGNNVCIQMICDLTFPLLVCQLLIFTLKLYHSSKLDMTSKAVFPAYYDAS